MKNMKYLLPLLLSFSLMVACRSGNMPQFDLLLLDKKTVLNTGEIPTGKPIVLMYFRTDCSYCRNETESIVKRMDALADTRFYFITIENSDKAKQFSDDYQLNEFENITIGNDTADYFSRHFEVKGTPTIAVYDQYKRLRGVFSGAPEIDTLVKVIKEL